MSAAAPSRLEARSLACSRGLATLFRDVSFRVTSRKYRNAIRTVNFDGARMDKLTYAGLKGLGADLSSVTVE